MSGESRLHTKDPSIKVKRNESFRNDAALARQGDGAIQSLAEAVCSVHFREKYDRPVQGARHWTNANIADVPTDRAARVTGNPAKKSVRPIGIGI
ncbi:hypothetical protein [Burkholderia cepacia]|uniref:hypothetical protein n=1 Tax=Burkholderia cepacia TaxID=292 RepID=UPI0012D9D96C|nr:hypothetical protein [Burkholderia cepacia]